MEFIKEKKEVVYVLVCQMDYYEDEFNWVYEEIVGIFRDKGKAMEIEEEQKKVFENLNKMEKYDYFFKEYADHWTYEAEKTDIPIESDIHIYFWIKEKEIL